MVYESRTDYEAETDDTPTELPEVATERGGLTPRQRSPRTDPSMRDGDSSHGNPYEMEGNDPTTDNDTGDVEDEPIHAGIDGGAVDGTPADMRPDVDTDADDFTLRADEDNTQAGVLDEERADETPPAVTDVLPHPIVNSGADGSTIGRNLPPAEAVHGVNIPRDREELKPAHKAAQREAGTTTSVNEEEQSPGLPIAGYEKLTVAEILKQVEALSESERKQVRAFEAHHRKRKTLLAKLDRMMEADGGQKPRRRSSKAGGTE